MCVGGGEQGGGVLFGVLTVELCVFQTRCVGGGGGALSGV